MKTYLVTGATGGLGLEIIRNLAKNSKNKVIMAIRNMDKGLKIACELSPNIELLELDLSELCNVKDFVRNWDTKLDGLKYKKADVFICIEIQGIKMNGNWFSLNSDTEEV